MHLSPSLQELEAMTRYTSPVNPAVFPHLTVVLLAIGMFFTAYEVTSTKYTRDVYKELLISLVASLFMGFGVLFLLLWVGIYASRNHGESPYSLGSPRNSAVPVEADAEGQVEGGDPQQSPVAPEEQGDQAHLEHELTEGVDEEVIGQQAQLNHQHQGVAAGLEHGGTSCSLFRPHLTTTDRFDVAVKPNHMLCCAGLEVSKRMDCDLSTVFPSFREKCYNIVASPRPSNGHFAWLLQVSLVGTSPQSIPVKNTLDVVIVTQ
ncbi:Transmembrane protein 258 [Merluccius polli]|uniref:Dolichyl-diphosphooligosaccharide--protein glycosyltransferase subunit TMEM258 n=1 Tax=Merluccius polli TaxID=89951 RepID=A0AA47MS44_MERPO|nr:Transmembrane protein 258 [Merluccius polli]